MLQSLQDYLNQKKKRKVLLVLPVAFVVGEELPIELFDL